MLRTIASVLLFITAAAYAMAPAAEMPQECGTSGTSLGKAYCVFCRKGDPTATQISFGTDITCTCPGGAPCAVVIDGKQGTWEDYTELLSS